LNTANLYYKRESMHQEYKETQKRRYRGNDKTGKAKTSFSPLQRTTRSIVTITKNTILERIKTNTREEREAVAAEKTSTITFANKSPVPSSTRRTSTKELEIDRSTISMN
jgi:hypothetical protein